MFVSILTRFFRPIDLTIKVTGKNTAVKIIAKKKLSDDDLAALMTEISILAEMDHPHIIKYVPYNTQTPFYLYLIIASDI
jgi:serine/threonine protein kinase